MPAKRRFLHLECGGKTIAASLISGLISIFLQAIIIGVFVAAHYFFHLLSTVIP